MMKNKAFSQTNRQIGKMDREEKWTDTWMDKQVNGQASGWTVKWIDR